MNLKIYPTIVFCLLIGLYGVASAQVDASNPNVTPTTPLTSASAAKPSIAVTEPELAPSQLKPLKLASIRIRIDPNTLDKTTSSNITATGTFYDIVTLREARDNAIMALNGHNVGGAVDKTDYQKIAVAANAVMQVCGAGSDYIQYRIRKNSNREFWVGLAGNLLTGGMIASKINATTKLAGFSASATQTYEKAIVKEGDTDRNTPDLRNALEDIRLEIASGMGAYNRALFMPTSTPAQHVTRYYHLQAAVLEMHSACAFF